MKHLIIMRHAKAEKDAPSGEDFDRRLSGRGREEAASVATALKAYGLKPDFALVSAAARTRDTFAQVEGVFGTINALVSKDLYHAGADAMRRALEKHENDGDCILLVGHNPGVQALVADYLFEGAAGADIIEKVRGGYPTATATVFEVDAAGRAIYDGIYLAK
ncbi:phosphohistidine phosphatase [Asticcacaulis sp. AC460]|uniref:SixA phosphatase family protein n=1 Tax=Asticcacaulis sp. AC460 TaxID=1282360 RepID=UPI0003C40E9B|nr:histidine phosphatase family protein [Asticcacaulis sp. AC460]ESQ88706.1 phosphohistidine phosphatase [Asticcacaulis sp. AC460]